MLDCVKFLLQFLASFITMLFTISTQDGMNIGVWFCIIFIFLPIVLRVIKIIRQDALEEINDTIEEHQKKLKKESDKK